MRRLFVLLLVIGLLLLVACGGGGEGETATPTATQQPSPTAVSPSPTATEEATPSSAIETSSASWPVTFYNRADKYVRIELSGPQQAELTVEGCLGCAKHSALGTGSSSCGSDVPEQTPNHAVDLAPGEYRATVFYGDESAETGSFWVFSTPDQVPPEASKFGTVLQLSYLEFICLDYEMAWVEYKSADPSAISAGWRIGYLAH
jgi:hypothetical protein